MCVCFSLLSGVLASGRSGCQQRVGQRLKRAFLASYPCLPAPTEAEQLGGSPQSLQTWVPRQLCWKYLVTQDSNLNHNRGVGDCAGRAVGGGR